VLWRLPYGLKSLGELDCQGKPVKHVGSQRALPAQKQIESSTAKPADSAMASKRRRLR
jgi:hypothetical protein